jgi:hypothetical protein
MAGTQACESTPSFGRLCTAMTKENIVRGHDGESCRYGLISNSRANSVYEFF